MLKTLINNTLTDKNTSHSYIDTYERLFQEKKTKKNNILEIGIGAPYHDKRNGGSIKLWYDYFQNSTIYGLDIIDISNVNECILNNERIKLYTSINAYDENFIKETFTNNNITFDILIDDGPHTLESMIFFVKHYLHLLNSGGILIIEDIQNIDWINNIKLNIPHELKKNIEIEVIDLREIKNRWDDIMFVIKKP